MAVIILTKQADTPATPSAGDWKLYPKSDGWYALDDAGTETGPFGAGSGWDGDIADIDLDGGTDIGAALADADLILVDDGAGGTNRKSALSRMKTYVQGIKLDDFTAPDDNTDLDAMASKHGLMSKAYASKLDGIEAAADVTDATNVNAAGAVMESDYDAQTILAATSDNTPTARTIGEAQIVGRQTGGNIGGIAQVSAGEKTAGTETALRGFSPDDVKDMIDTHGGGDSVVVQQKYTQSGAEAHGANTDLIPYDDTIPQNTEGKEWTALATAITPTSATNILDITVVLNVSCDTLAFVTAALFQDTTANALAVSMTTVPATNYMYIITINYQMVAGTTSETTFKVRCGGNVTSVTTLNGVASARKYGGTMMSSMKITEILVP